jgi:hypothetical protein
MGFKQLAGGCHSEMQLNFGIIRRPRTGQVGGAANTEQSARATVPQQLSLPAKHLAVAIADVISDKTAGAGTCAWKLTDSIPSSPSRSLPRVPLCVDPVTLFFILVVSVNVRSFMTSPNLGPNRPERESSGTNMQQRLAQLEGARMTGLGTARQEPLAKLGQCHLLSPPAPEGTRSRANEQSDTTLILW